MRSSQSILTLSDRLEPDSGSAERIDPVSGVERIEPAEPILIPSEDNVELASTRRRLALRRNPVRRSVSSPEIASSRYSPTIL